MEAKTPWDALEESRIVERCRDGDLAAYRRIFERYEKPLLRTACRLLGSPQEAEDAVQESFLKLYRGIVGFRSGACFSTYLFRILINTCTDMRRKRRWKDYEEREMDRLPAAPRESSGFPLARIIDRLPERMKACFILSAVEEFTLREVADTLHLNVGTVKANVHRARKKLRTWLAAETAETKS